MEKLKVFVSSTVEDLTEERNAIKETLSNLKFEPYLCERDTAHPEPPIKVCMSNINACDIFILIIGERYGYKPEKSNGTPYNGDISVTHGEFKKAKELRKPILVFVKEISREEAEDEFYKSLTGFLDGNFIKKFNTVDELVDSVNQAIPNLLTRLVRHEYVPPWEWTPNVIIAKNGEEASIVGAKILGCAIQNRPNANIGVSAGTTVSDIYFKFFQVFNRKDMKNFVTARFYSVTEHFGIGPESNNSYYRWFHQAIFERVEKEWGYKIPDENKKLVPSSIGQSTIQGFYDSYDNELRINKVDVQIISPAPNGQIISIDPRENVLNEMLKGGTELVYYSPETSEYLVPKSPHNMDIIIGMKNLLQRSERLIIPAVGAKKSTVVKRMILGPTDSNCPASLVSEFPNTEKLLFIIDQASAGGLPGDIKNYTNLIDPVDWNFFWEN